MREADAAAVLAVQRAAYGPAHHESWEVLGRKRALWPAGCWVVDDGPDLAGYLFSHPGRWDEPPRLHAALALPAQPDAYAIHDLALHPRARGRGWAPQLVACALQQAQAAGLPALSLVAVQGSAGFWARWGFVAQAPAPPQLASYGSDAVFMRRAAPESGAAR